MIPGVRVIMLLATLAAGVAAVPPKNGTLFGAWYLTDLNGPTGGTMPKYLPSNMNYVLLSFVQPGTMEFPEEFKDTVKQLSSNRTVMVSIGGESYGSDWTWLADKDQATAAGQKAASWASFGIDGIDIDAEDAATQNPPENMVAFMQAIKDNAPHLKISLCVYGNPEGRNFLNYLINNHLNGSPRLIDWIHIMAYAGYDLDVSYIENYTKAPKSKYDHPIDAAVPNDSVVIAMKAPAGFLPNCDPQDYSQMVSYVQQTGLRGVSLWAVVNDNGSVPLPWCKPGCEQGYCTLCKGLIGLRSCCENINQTTAFGHADMEKRMRVHLP